MNCQRCGCSVSNGDMFCPECGAKIEQQAAYSGQEYNMGNGQGGYQNGGETKFCPNCGTVMPEGDRFCPNCGTDTNAPSSVGYKEGEKSYALPPQKKNNTAVIVAIIIGAIVIIAGIFSVPKIVDYILEVNESTGFESGGSGGSSKKDDESDKDDENESEDDKEKEKEKEKTYAPPAFESLNATSTRGADKDSATGQYVYYYPSYICDGDFSTAWSSNRNIELTPTFTFSSNEKQHVSGLRMTNGYCKSEKTYTKNRRITRVRVTYEGGEVTQDFSIENYRNMIDVPFPSAVDTTYVSIQVLDTHYGDWKDIAISEVEFY